MEVASASSGVSELEPVASMIDDSSMYHLDNATYTGGESPLSSGPPMNVGGEIESATAAEVDRLLEELSELDGIPLLGAASEDVNVICNNNSEEQVGKSVDENSQIQNNTVQETEAEPTVEPSVAGDEEKEILDVAIPDSQNGQANDTAGENETLESSGGSKETGRKDLPSLPSQPPIPGRRSSVEDSDETRRTAVNLKIPAMPTFFRASVTSPVSIPSVTSPSSMSAISPNTLNMNILKNPIKKPELGQINSEQNESDKSIAANESPAMEATSVDPVHAPDNVAIIIVPDVQPITQSDCDDNSKSSGEVPTNTVTPDDVPLIVSDNQQCTQNDCDSSESSGYATTDTVDQANASDNVPLIVPDNQHCTQNDCDSSEPSGEVPKNIVDRANNTHDDDVPLIVPDNQHCTQNDCDSSKSSGDVTTDTVDQATAPDNVPLIVPDNQQHTQSDCVSRDEEPVGSLPNRKEKEPEAEEISEQMSEPEETNHKSTPLTVQSARHDEDHSHEDTTPNTSVIPEMTSSDEKGKESTDSEKNGSEITLTLPSPKPEVEVKKQYKSEITMAGQQIMADNYPKTYIKAELNKYKCLVCGQGGFPHFNDLRYHREQTHPQIPFNANEEMPFGCGVCGKPFHLREDALVCALLAHDPTSLHKQMFRYACSQCPEKNFRFHSIIALKRHWEVDHCHTFLLSESFDGKSTSEAEEVPLPSVVINETEALKIKAGELPIQSIFPLIVERDLINLENDNAPEEKNHIHLCTICHAMMNNNYELNNHMMKHTAREARKPTYKCNKCPEKFKRLTALRHHFKIHLKTFKKSKRLKRNVDKDRLANGKAITLKGQSTASGVGRIAGKRGRPRKFPIPTAKDENVNKTNLKKLANGIMNAIKHRNPRSSSKKHETDFEATSRMEKERKGKTNATESPANSASLRSQSLKQLNPLKLFKCNLCTGTDPKAFTTFRSLQSHKRFGHQLHPMRRKHLKRIEENLHANIIKNPGFVLLYDVLKKKDFTKYQSRKHQGSFGGENSKAESESKRHSKKVNSLDLTKCKETESVIEDRNKSNRNLRKVNSVDLTKCNETESVNEDRNKSNRHSRKVNSLDLAKCSETESVNDDRNKSNRHSRKVNSLDLAKCKETESVNEDRNKSNRHSRKVNSLDLTKCDKTVSVNEDRNKNNHGLEQLPPPQIDTPTKPRRKFQCKVCLRFFTKRRFLNKHEKIHTEKPKIETKLSNMDEIEVVEESPVKRGPGRPRKSLMTRVSSVALSFMKKTEDSFANEGSPQVVYPRARKEDETTASTSPVIRKGPGRPLKQNSFHKPAAITNIGNTANEILKQKCRITFGKVRLERLNAAQSDANHQVKDTIAEESRTSVQRSSENKRESKRKNPQELQINRTPLPRPKKKRWQSPQEIKINQTPSPRPKKKGTSSSSISLIHAPVTEVKAKHAENVTLMFPAKRGRGRPSPKKVASESLGTFHVSASVLSKMKKCQLVLTRCDEFSGKSNALKKTLPVPSSSKSINTNTRLDDVQTQFTRKRKYTKGESRNDPPKHPRDSRTTPLVNPNPVTCQLLMFKKQEHSFERVFPSTSTVQGHRDSDESSPASIPHPQTSNKGSALKPGRSRNPVVSPTTVEEEVITKRKRQSPSRDTRGHRKQAKTQLSPSSNVSYIRKCQIPKVTNSVIEENRSQASDREKRLKKHGITTHVTGPRKMTRMEKTGGREETPVRRSMNRDTTPTRKSKKLKRAQ